jgi:hypothetical protein
VLSASLLAIRPVRAMLEHALGIGYLQGVGFVRVSETRILEEPVVSVKLGQTIGIDQVVASSSKTQIWFHSTGAKYSPEAVNGKFDAYLESDGEKLPIISWIWEEGGQKGALEFSSLTSEQWSFTLHMSPEWSIPIQLVPMSSTETSRGMTIYPNVCQSHRDVQLCLRAFVSDATGYHLWLSAVSVNPVFYFETLDTSNRLTGEGAALKDASGKQLDQIYPSETSFPGVLPPYVTALPKEVRTTLSFERQANTKGPLELSVGGLTGKTPASETIVCKLGDNPQIGDSFPCERSITISGEQISFHEGVIIQKRDGIRLSLLSDPIEPTNGLLVTGVDIESLEYINSSYYGEGFNPMDNQLEIWLGLDKLTPDKKFAIRITGASLTIVEPFRLTWNSNP